MSMNLAERRTEINEVTERIIACVYRVSSTLGSGFLEKVYENALAIEFRLNGLKVQQQHPIRVVYNGQPVGDFAADLLVEDCVVVELKSARALDDVHSAQCLNYLKATGLRVCLLVNFGKPRAEEKRPGPGLTRFLFVGG
jgi:GxxExxY protein